MIPLIVLKHLQAISLLPKIPNTNALQHNNKNEEK